jgi:RNA polymerase sigma factor (sigma-70 family)
MTRTLDREISVDPRMFLSAHYQSISNQARQIGRRQGLPEQYLDDFVGDVMVKLLEGDCAVLRVFEGRAGFRSYVSAVIVHLAQDRRNHLWGKWRPTAEARRLGPLAVALERLLARDGFCLTEAARKLQECFEVDLAEIEALAARLPLRPRRRLVELDGLEDELPGNENQVDTLTLRAGRRELRGSLAQALARLDRRTRQVLAWRFERGCRAEEIARALDLRPREVYGILDSARKKLRRELETCGFDALSALAGLGRDIFG